MAGKVGLHDLVGSVASAIVEAQGMVENAFLSLVRRRFDRDGRPYGIHVRLPRAPGAVPDHEDVHVPLLALVESRMLAIDSIRIDLDVELGDMEPPPAVDALAPGMGQGAPIDVPAIPSIDAPVPGRAAAPVAAAAPLANAPDRTLTVGVGDRAAPDGPTARLSIRVKAAPPSESLLRLLTQLNKLNTPTVPPSTAAQPNASPLPTGEAHDAD